MRIGEAGRRGENIRSDCYVKLEILNNGKKNIEIKSKVYSLYGKSIKELTEKMLNFFEIDSYNIYLEDTGALPFTLCARIECAIKRALKDKEVRKGYILEQIPIKSISTRDRLRRSRLYLPGNEPKFMINAAIHKPDGIILDLEDSVAPSEKDAARILVRNALCQIDFKESERMVRINPLNLGGDKDLEEIIPFNPQLILIPKCETKEDVIKVNEKIKKLTDKEIFLMPIIETALGVLNSYEIAKACKEIVALTIGLEDYTADIGTQRTLEGKESFWARCQLVNSAKAARVQAIDSVFSDVSDMEGLRKSVLEAKSLGFEGKGCIHPRQIKVIHEAFAPTPQELEKAKKIYQAFKEAQEKGLNVVSLGSKMIDPPVVKRALKIVEWAEKYN